LPEHLIKLGLFAEFAQDNFASNDALTWIANHNFDAIIHCAGTSLVGPSITNPQVYYANNFVRTQRLVDHLMIAKWQGRFIFSSSAATYGTPVMTPCQEVDPTEPISPYGQSKLMIDWMLESYHRAYNLDYVSFRYFNACGADPTARHGQEPGATHIIARVLESMRDGQTFTLNGTDYDTADGTCVRDYIHVADLAQAHINAMVPGIPSGIYNLGTSTGISNQEIINTAQTITGKTLNVQTGPKREGDPAVLTADAAKFIKVSGWEPQYELHDIIGHAWAWYNV
jgi:UDP-glucose 4-epimerase